MLRITTAPSPSVPSTSPSAPSAWNVDSSVLDRLVAAQPLGRIGDDEAGVGQAILERAGKRDPAPRVAVDHPQAVALVLRIEPDEGRVADQDLRLEHAGDSVPTTRSRTGCRRCRARRGRRRAPRGRLIQRRRVDDRRHRAVLEAAIEQPPWVGAFGVGRICIVAANVKRPPRATKAGDAPDARVVRPIQIEAAAVVAGPDAEQIEGGPRASARHRASRGRTATGPCRGRIEHQGHHRSAISM